MPRFRSPVALFLLCGVVLATCAEERDVLPERFLVAELAAARVLGSVESAPPPGAAAMPSARALVLGPGAEVRFHLRTTSGASLRIGRVEVEQPGTELEIRIETHGKPARRHRLGPSQDVALPVFEDAVVRIDLQAVGRGPVRIEGARVAGVAGAGVAPEPLALGFVPNIIVFVVDTLRADSIRLGDARSPESPAMTAFAEQSLHFETAWAQSPWTRPSVASIFTGLYPPSHGLEDADEVLSPSFTTLSEYLRAAGGATAAFVGNVQLQGRFGFEQGFDVYEEVNQRDPYPMHTARDVVDAALAWLDGREGEQPVLLYLHSVDPHTPYRAEEPFLSRFAQESWDAPAADAERAQLDLVRQRYAPDSGSPAWDGLAGSASWMIGLTYGWLPSSPAMATRLRSLYDGEVAETDHHFARLLRGLRERGIFEEAVIVLVSDHGEEFYEHGGWTHNRSLYAEVIDVPLYIKLPASLRAQATARVRRAQHVDLLPTLLTLAGVRSGGPFDGEVLISATEGPQLERATFSFVDKEAHSGATVAEGPWKLIRMTRPEPQVALYDLAHDPGEQHDLSSERPIERDYLAGKLRALTSTRAAAEPPETAPDVELDDETRRRMEAMGYLEAREGPP